MNRESRSDAAHRLAPPSNLMGAVFMTAFGGGVATIVASVALGVLLGLLTEGPLQQGGRGLTSLDLLMLYTVFCAPYVLAATFVGQYLPRNWPLAALTAWCPLLVMLWALSEVSMAGLRTIMSLQGAERGIWAVFLVPLSVSCFCAVSAFAAAHWPGDRSWS